MARRFSYYDRIVQQGEAKRYYLKETGDGRKRADVLREIAGKFSMHLHTMRKWFPKKA